MTLRTTTAAPRRRRAWQRAGILLLVALSAVSCKKVALTAPSGTTLTLYTSRTTTGLNSSVTITAVVIESGGTPVHDGTSVSFFSTLGTMTPATVTTSNGQAVTQLVTDTLSGTAEVSAVSGGAKLASTVKVTVGAVAVGRVDVSATPTSLPSTGGASVVVATVSDSTGNRLQSIPVNFTADAGAFDASSVSTDSTGQATTRLTTTTSATVTAAVAGGTSGSVTGTAKVTVRPAATVAFGTVALTARTAAITYTAVPGAGGASIVSVSMSFGDGTSISGLTAGTSQTIGHLFGGAGAYTLVLTVTDSAGETFSAATTIVVT